MEMDEEKELRSDILFSLQRALLGEVPPALRAVAVAWEGKTIKIFSYFDGDISEDDRESMSCVQTEVIADFPEDFKVFMNVERIDAPSPIPDFRPEYDVKHQQRVYHRREST